jgi:hypothetical protein
VYIVFRRNDGYVGSVYAETALAGRQRVAGYANRAGERVDYDILGECDEWAVARLLLIAHRVKCSAIGCDNARDDGTGELCAPCWNDLNDPHPRS